MRHAKHGQSGLTLVGRGAIAVVCLALLAGCAATREPVITGSVPDDGYRTRHPILISEGTESIDLPVGRHLARLTERDQGTVMAFGTEARENGASVVTIMFPTGSSNQAAAYRVSRQMGAALAAGGFTEGSVRYEPYRAEDPMADAPIRLAYQRMKAGLDHACGQWPENALSDKENKDYWNFGCSTQNNVAAMVVNPADLVTPRGMSAASAARRQTIFKKYEAGEATRSKQTLEKEGSITSLSGG
jgi:pilus assembly protein CpaD